MRYSIFIPAELRNKNGLPLFPLLLDRSPSFLLLSSLLRLYFPYSWQWLHLFLPLPYQLVLLLLLRSFPLVDGVIPTLLDLEIGWML